MSHDYERWTFESLCFIMSTFSEYILIYWLSFVILRTSSTEIKQLYRKLEKTNIKIIKTRCHLQFNKTCLLNGLLPTYTNVRLHDDAARNEVFVLEFRKNLIERQVCQQKECISSLSEECKNLRRQFCQLINSPLRFKAFMFFPNRTCV